MTRRPKARVRSPTVIVGRGARLSRDESRILSWSRDRSVHLWDVVTGREVIPAMMHDGRVSGAVLNGDDSPQPHAFVLGPRQDAGRPVGRSAPP